MIKEKEKMGKEVVKKMKEPPYPFVLGSSFIHAPRQRYADRRKYLITCCPQTGHAYRRRCPGRAI